MTLEQAQLHDIPLVMMIQNWENMHGIVKTRVIRHIRLAIKGQTRGDCTTCTEMYGNGCRMNGIILTTALQLMAVHGKMELALAECFVVAAGYTVPGAAGQPAASPTSRASASTASVFAFFRKCNSFLLYPFTTYNSLQS